jgi:hypothetical protein
VATYKKSELVNSLIWYFDTARSAATPTAAQEKAREWLPDAMRFPAVNPDSVAEANSPHRDRRRFSPRRLGPWSPIFGWKSTSEPGTKDLIADLPIIAVEGLRCLKADFATEVATDRSAQSDRHRPAHGR